MDEVAERISARIAAHQWDYVRFPRDNPQAGPLDAENLYGFIQPEDKRSVSLWASETLHCLRSSLDHAVYTASWLARGKPADGTQFPVCFTPDEWASDRTARQLGQMRAEHAAWIEAVQPCRGVAWTKELHSLHNMDKHRKPIEATPTVQFDVDLSRTYRDPRDSSVLLVPVEHVGIRVRLVGIKRKKREQKRRDIAEVFNPIFRGAGELLNRFLAEEGLPLLRIPETDPPRGGLIPRRLCDGISSPPAARLVPRSAPPAGASPPRRGNLDATTPNLYKAWDGTAARESRGCGSSAEQDPR
ncbi:hypothetical protein [Pseudonocardia halophobica]|nr:hypothetical protein [Pseudonocardia halophobica]